MDDTRLAPAVGTAACLAVVAVLALPYLIVDSATAVGTYYARGVIDPQFAGLFALVCVIVFAAGRAGRSDPALAAGAALVFGLFVLLLCLLWALTVPTELVFSLTRETTIEYHRHLLVAVAALVPASALWYARALGLV
ncbi:hypothetical protein ACFQPA_07790 [Halomarina halobia]|uniref:DUF4149 domain-containing protein n=1 Tax=Halomarina halobia TaxID=3033386 RepID=A0ABD6ACM3_9EURY|nr:hypothetical protein [Halomarina sp. PSR21]